MAADARFSIEIVPGGVSSLAEDVRRGLAGAQKSIPPKYFYDQRGADLFEAICELPEYYLTRAEQSLLESHAPEILASARPSDLIEFGSGSARKTRLLLDAAGQNGAAPRYHPFDVCEPALRESGRALLEAYPWLRIHAIVGDCEHDLEHLPEGRRRLVAFLGSTIGNFTPAGAARFVGRLGERLGAGEWFLLGADLVKDVARLEAAYDDRAGVTAEFNRNALRVINRELGADFEPEAFEHVAFFDAAKSQIEMHLRSRRAQRITIGKLGMTVRFRAGETIHTEISRKFTRAELERLCAQGGFAVRRWFAPPDESFALVLSEKI